MEQEIKLRVTQTQPLLPEQLAELANLQSPPTEQHIENRYFDTADLQLLKLGVGLRLRLKSGQWLQTVKTAGQAINGLHQRQEWEVPVGEAAFDLQQLRQTPLAAVIDNSDVWSQVKQIFTTDFIRMSWQFNWQGSQIEMAYDRGQVQADNRQASIHEVELELMAGELTALQSLAEQLCRQLPMEPHNQSKAALGYALLAEQAGS